MGRKRADDIEDIQAMRIQLGMKLISRGHTPCHQCGRVFYSEDTERERHCPKCRKIMGILERSTQDTSNYYRRAFRATGG